MKRMTIGILLAAIVMALAACGGGGGGPAATSKWTFSIISDAGAATSLVTMNASKPLVLEIYNANAPSTLVGTLKFTDKTQTRSLDGLTPGETYIAIGYSDVNNNGLDIGDVLGPVEGVQAIATGETQSTYYPWLNSNIGPQRTVTNVSFARQFALIQWSYSGASPFSGNHITTVVTSNPANVADHTSWAYYPNGSANTGNMMLVNGLDPSKTYGLFVYDDQTNPYQGTLETGEKYYWSSLGSAFPALPAGQQFQAHALTATPTVLSAYSTVATY